MDQNFLLYLCSVYCWVSEKLFPRLCAVECRTDSGTVAHAPCFGPAPRFAPAVLAFEDSLPQDSVEFFPARDHRQIHTEDKLEVHNGKMVQTVVVASELLGVGIRVEVVESVPALVAGRTQGSCCCTSAAFAVDTGGRGALAFVHRFPVGNSVRTCPPVR